MGYRIAPYPDEQVHAVFDAGYFTLAPPTEVVPEVQQHPMWDPDSTGIPEGYQ
jgi:hypothetical protein